MARLKKAADYISELCASESENKRNLGETLKTLYEKWTKTLALKDFLEFNEIIMANRTEIGKAQFFGKFRAYAFEEYIYRLLKEKIRLGRLEIFWAEKCLVWQENGEEYAIEFDISMGTKKGEFVDPTVVLDAKVELDSSRLKTAVASFAMLKQWKPEAKCAVVYIKRELDASLLKLARNWADGIFQLSLKNNETAAFLDFVAKCLSADC
ncbi:MAG: hypothetical protein QW510_03230 [Candidatus Bathyarchaeia archaeon]